jgi:RNA polymerase sigma-54 factor
MELRQYLKLSQQLVMTPQLQQAIKLLQLSRLEMSSLIRDQLNENPLLEDLRDTEGAESTRAEVREVVADRRDREVSGDGAMGGSAGEGAVMPGGGSNEPVPRDGTDLNWQTFVENYNYFSYAPGSGVKLTNDELPSLEQTLSRRSSLSDHLEWQVHLTQFTPEETEIGLQIVGNINEDGYLKDMTLEDLAERTGADVEAVEEVLLRVQEFDPVGVGARDLRECLLIQAETFFPENRIVYKVIRDHLEDIEKRNMPAILRALKIDKEELREALRIISNMEPKPGRAFITEEPQYITPDVYVYKVGDEYVTVLNEDGLPKLKVSNFYRNMLHGNPTAKEKEYIQDKFRSAVWLIRSIHQRQNTIRKVTESIVRFQREFLDRGVAYLRPLILRDVAEDIGMHESTVSRVTTNKYVHTPQGIFELKYFFNSRISGTRGEDLASESVKIRIKQMIETEDKKRPHSDQKLVEMLRKENIDIARRTVAKYREMLGILSSSKRKQLL